MRKLIATFGCTLLLSACGGGGGTEASCTSEYWDGTVGTCLPDAWHVVDRAELDERGVPAEVVAAFQSDTPFSGQFATVTVTREPLAEEMTYTEYSEASVESVTGLPGYVELDKQNITIDGEDVTLHVFTAQPSEDQPESRFYQVSMANDGNGYTFTVAVPVSVSEELEEQVLTILQNATLQEPEGEE